MPPADEHDMADEDELAEFVRRKAEEVAIAKNSSLPLLLDPKKIMDFINLWCEKPDTPLDDLDLPPGPSHVLTAFILNEKYKIEQAKLVRKQKLQKKKELQRNMLTISPQQLVSMQAEIQQLSEEYERQANHCCGVRDRFIYATKQVVDEHNKKEAAKVGQAPPSSSSAQPQTPQASASTSQPEEPARATEKVVPEECARVTASVAPEENAPSSSSAAEPPRSSPLKTITLSSASEAKKTKAAEKEAMKKRKASAPPAVELVKKLKMVPMSSTEPIDAPPLASAPPTQIITNLEMMPFGEDYIIPDDSDTHSAATTEQMDDEIEAETNASPPMVSSPPPTVTDERAGDEETEEDVDIDGSTTPVIHDEFWDAAHPNSPITTPLTQIPQSPAVTEEVHTGSEDRQPTLQTIAEEIPAASAKEIDQPELTIAAPQQSSQREGSVPSTGTDTVPFATAEEIAKSDDITDKNDSTGSPRPIFDVRPKRINLQPVPSMPKVGKSVRRPQFDNAAFFAEKNFFIGTSPYDSSQDKASALLDQNADEFLFLSAI